MMSLCERARNEGWMEGLEEGMARAKARREAMDEAKNAIAAINEILELVRQGFTPEESCQKLISKYTVQ